ncbi:MAG: alpha-ketoglutarate-dependent dioxygenase AlkB [Acidobacteria bacterium]|nr:alpha-ketoglutarate-dependent dioxygenase AlkB [Acidobacteriota bacterium]
MKPDNNVLPNYSLWDELHFSPNSESRDLPMPDGEVIIFHDFFGGKESDDFFQTLLSGIKWRQDKIRYYGKEMDLPRLTAWYGDKDKSYTYSRIPMKPEPWTPILLLIKERIETAAGVNFNSVLLNLYRNGRDSVSWHSDDEPELGENPTVGSVSFGQTRTLQFRHKLRKELSKIDVQLTHGSLLLMKGQTQRFWQHQIPKTTRHLKSRINLTFRVIY